MKRTKMTRKTKQITMTEDETVLHAGVPLVRRYSL